jgi:signal peptidase
MKGFLTVLYYVFVLAVGGLGALLLLVHLEVINGYELRIVQSGSMEPTISTGSLVLVQAQERYAVDDIVTFRTGERDGIPTTHRIVADGLRSGELVYTTKGDANEEADLEPVTQREIIGRVIVSAPYLGYLLDFARQPLGFMLLIVLPALLIVFEEATSLWQAWRGRPEKDKTAAV